MSEIAAGMKELSLGATGRYTAEAVASVRGERGLTYQALSDRLTSNGWSIPVLGLRRIESRARRVSVDDLMALAAALEVSPLRLVLPRQSPAEPPTGLNPDMTDSQELYAWARDEVSQDPRSREEYWLHQIGELQQELIEAIHMEESAKYRSARIWTERARTRIEAQIKHAESRLREVVEGQNG